MYYTVEVKREKDWFWKKFKKVKGDALMEDSPEPTRFLVLEDESRVEIPIRGTLFKFSPERFMVIKQNLEKNSK